MDNSNQNSHFFPLPIKVGYEEENPVYLKSHHGKAIGHVQYTGEGGKTHPYGVDGQWNSNWTSQGDAMEWTVDFIRDAQYEIGITANGIIGDQACIFKISVGDTEQEQILPAFDVDPDTWKYFPLMTTTAHDSATVRLSLEQISNPNNLNINELVIKRLE